MKFNIENIKKYDGEDLILLVGCPGSRWSSTYNFIELSPLINTTDKTEENRFNLTILHVDGTYKKIGNHYASYWGPYQKQGHKFDKLNEMSKAEILNEFMMPFSNWDKIKVIKSHWFSYHLEYIHYLFPKAKIISCYANDIDSFYRWHKCGGWGITYPKYTWYQDDSRMLEKIKEENYRILKFNKDRDTEFKLLKISELHQKLGLFTEIEKSKDVQIKCEVAIYDGSYIPNFKHLTR
jgi:hypothetical protein